MRSPPCAVPANFVSSKGKFHTKVSHDSVTKFVNNCVVKFRFLANFGSHKRGPLVFFCVMPCIVPIDSQTTHTKSNLSHNAEKIFMPNDAWTLLCISKFDRHQQI